MIEILVSRDKNGKINQFIIKGHAMYDESGKDIVCASVSAVSGCAIVGLEKLLKISPAIEVNEGYLKCTLPSNISENDLSSAYIILETMILGLKDIEQNYKKYIKVSD